LAAVDPPPDELELLDELPPDELEPQAAASRATTPITATLPSFFLTFTSSAGRSQRPPRTTANSLMRASVRTGQGKSRTPRDRKKASPEPLSGEAASGPLAALLQNRDR
jgi:hypothetical protein